MHYFSSEASWHMLRITTEKKKGRTVLNVEGRLSGPRVPMLEQCWREMRADAPDEKFSRSNLIPNANLQVSDSARRQNIETGFGQKIPGIPEHSGPFQVFNAGVAVGTPIFDLTLWRRYQAAKELAGAQKSTSESTREQVILLVVSQYIGSLRAEANVTASKSRVELAQALYDQAADLQKEGVGTGIDTLRANVELQNEKQALIQAENDRHPSH